ncbi:MAG: radical SAM protein [Cyanobacteria bacterium REEB494]|nr:radical SAM protein [Cyanobacteria bacterium REEB494]
MARIVLTDAKVTINSVNLSSYISSVTLNTSTDVVETTGFSSTAARTRVAGLQDNSVTIEFFQDFATSLVEQTIYPLLGSTTTVVVLPTSSAASATNPSYTFTALVSEWQPLSGAVGELSTASVTWPISGAITKAVA